MQEEEKNNKLDNFNANIITFLYQSIADSQSTIRSIDTKLGFILVLNLIPITNIGKIYSKVYSILLNELDLWMLILKIILLITCLILWFIACLCTYRGISSIDNPKGHIKSVTDVNGFFYSGNLYEIKFYDMIINRKKLKSKQTFIEYCKQRPKSDEDIISELSFEKMKLSYIRDIKIERQLGAFKYTACWVILGIFIYFFFRSYNITTLIHFF